MMLKFNIPKAWNELNPWQFKTLVWLLFTRKPNAPTQIKMVFAIFGVRWWQWYKLPKMYMLFKEVPLSQFKDIYPWVYQENTRSIFPPAFKVGKQTLYPPMDRLANLTAAEFAAADDMHIKFRQTKNIEYLYYLAAVLYTTNPRPQFNKLNLPALVQPFYKVPHKQLLAIEVAFDGCKNIIANRFRKVFPKPVGQQKKKRQKYGFGKIILEMTHKDLSKYQTISDVNIYTFLEQVQQDIVDASKKPKKPRKWV